MLRHPRPDTLAAGLVATVLWSLVLVAPLWAQANADGSTVPASAVASVVELERSDVVRRLDGIAAELEQIEAAFLREDLDDETLVTLRSRVTPLIAETSQTVQGFQPEQSRLAARLDELGPVPEGQDTDTTDPVAASRAALRDEIAKVEATVRRARLLNVQALQLESRVAALRRDKFTERLLDRTTGLLNPTLWTEFVAAIPAMTSSLARFSTDSLAFSSSRLTPAIFLIVGGLGITFFTLLRIVRRRIARRLEEAEDEDEALAKRRLYLGALATVLVEGVLLPLGIIGLVVIIREFSVFPDRALPVVRSVLGAVAIICFLRSLSLAYLSPYNPARRLVPFEDGPSLQIHGVILAIATFTTVDNILAEIGTIAIAPISFEAATSATMSIVVAALLFVGLRRVAAARQGIQVQASDAGLFRWSFIRIALWISILIMVVSAIVGFVALASFASRQVVGILAVIAFVSLILSVIEYALIPTTKPSGAINVLAARELGFSTTATHQIGLILGGLLRIAIIVLAVMFILVPWGYDAVNWVGWIDRAASGFTVGEVTISPVAVISGIFIFLIGWVAVRAIRTWFEETYLPSTALDVGLQNSIATGLGYLGIVFVAFVSVSFVGLDLSNLAIIAGALSVGIGFGLQSIVNNFVSGLILLAERPIKAGDWIVVGAEQGTVRKISVRATEIETFDRASLIVPNSDLISSQVKNWTHSNTLGRIVLSIGVSYDADPDEVKALLLDAARDHDLILSFPEPQVYFMEFGASSLDFSLYAFLADVGSGLGVRSDLRFDIMRRFKEAGIEIPFPQQDLNVRTINPHVAEDLGILPVSSEARKDMS